MTTTTDLRRFKADFFKALSHPLRIALLEQVRDGELGVNELCYRLKIEQSTVSQHLGVLRHRNILVTRKVGLNVYYSARDKGVFKVLDAAKQIFANYLFDIHDMLIENNRSPKS